MPLPFLLPELAELNQIRLDDDKSHRELADAIGLSESGLNRLLGGTRQPTDRTLHKIRKFLKARTAEQHDTGLGAVVQGEFAIEGSAK